MRWSMLLGIAAAASGCYVGPVFELKKESKRTCEDDFFSWGGGLTHHVVQGPGDGTFDYDPTGDLVDRVDGFYDLDVGDFWWWTYYKDDSHRVTDHATGFGTLWRDGDMDVEYTLDVAWADGVDRTYEVRTKRYGCEETTQTGDEDGPISVVEGVWSTDAFTYVTEWIAGPILVTAEGVQSADGAWVESEDLEDGDLVMRYDESGDGDGGIVRSFLVGDGVVEVEGSWERFVDGEVVFSYTSKRVGTKRETWSYTLNGEGRGEGVWDQDGVSCDLVFEDFECARQGCGASNGVCEPPVAYPRR